MLSPVQGRRTTHKGFDLNKMPDTSRVLPVYAHIAHAREPKPNLLIHARHLRRYNKARMAVRQQLPRRLH